MSKKNAVGPRPEGAPAVLCGFQALNIARLHARYGLRKVIAVQGARMVLRLGFSAIAAVTAGRLVMNQSIEPWMVALAAIILVALALMGFVADVSQAQVETAVAAELRDAAEEKLSVMPARQLKALPVGGFIVAMQRYPESLAALVVTHRAATIMMAVGPLAAAAALIIVSWQSAALIICLTPVMIVFFALVGDAIRRRAIVQEQTFGRLATQFADRIRTLPTILANQALPVEEAKLAARLEIYARKTMDVLGIAFINAGIIDFFASLSIAMLAVFLGLGHLNLIMIPGFSHLQLWQTLFILMIAPEYFAPFRRFAEQYHTKADGLAAAAALDKLLDAEAPELPARVEFGRLDWRLPERGLVAILGPSGSGKSTLLRQLAGIEKADIDRPSLANIVWVSTDTFIPEGALVDAISWRLKPLPPEKVAEAARAVGLLADALLPDGLDAQLTHGGANLSGGQRLRVSVARALLAERAVMADEPTAKLDAATASLVRQSLLDIARSRLVIVATHDEELAAAARQVIDLHGGEKLEVAA